jgi:D-tagatose-1,6-bisphosphate aldolase subunit GatZ/KbaZ
MTPGKKPTPNNSAQQAQSTQFPDPSTRFQDVLRQNRKSGKGGVYAVCSAHHEVIGAAIQQTIQDDSVLHVESTSSQVNQFGGYTGQTPRQFADYVRSAAQTAGLPAERILLGGDHLGPFPWRPEVSSSALEKASELVRDCVLAGYAKIHLDTSMPCADDRTADFAEETIAQRAALLCQMAEKAYAELPSGSPQVVYVVGTEVPAPGGESAETHAPAITAAEHVHRTLASFRQAFEKRDLFSAWERVIAIVVQPGVDFGTDTVFDYDRNKASLLSAALSDHPAIVYEAHSTDYQSATSLAELVQDHFAILKVGPWLTFALREAILALTAIEQEMLTGKADHPLSQVRGALERAMLRNPIHWRSYYDGNQEEISRQLIYSYSDRCRYYWNDSSVQAEIGRLLDNLGARAIPPTLVSQFLPLEYDAVRSGQIQATPEALIQNHISRVLRDYARACAG